MRYSGHAVSSLVRSRAIWEALAAGCERNWEADEGEWER